MEYLNSYSYFLMDQILEKVDYEWDFNKNVETDHRTNITKKLKVSIEKANDKTNWLERLLDKIKPMNFKIKHGILLSAIPILLSVGMSKNEIDETIKSVDKELIEVSIDTSDTERDIDTTAYTTRFTEDPTSMSTSDKGKEYIKGEEKLRLTAYSIGDGMITIGYGHAKPSRKSKYNVGDKISIERAERYFKKDIKVAEKGIRRIFKKWKKDNINIELTQNQFDVMVSMAFNMGVSGLRNTDFVQLVKQNKIKEASEKIQSTGTEKRFGGLSKRRKEESHRFNS